MPLKLSLACTRAPLREHQVEQSRIVADLAGGDQVRALLRAVLVVDVGPGLDQQACGVDVVAVRGQHQCGRAGVVDGFDVGPVRQRRPQSVDVSVRCGAQQSRVGTAPAAGVSWLVAAGVGLAAELADAMEEGGREAREGDRGGSACPVALHPAISAHSSAAPRTDALTGQWSSGRPGLARVACGR